MFIQHMVEVKGGGFVGDTLKTQARELAQDGLFVQRLFHRRIAITKPVPYSMNPQHGRQRVGRTTAFILGVVRLDQGNQAMPRYNPIHLEQEQIFAGLLAFSASAKAVCCIGKLGGCVRVFYQNQEVFFSVSL